MSASSSNIDKRAFSGGSYLTPDPNRSQKDLAALLREIQAGLVDPSPEHRLAADAAAATTTAESTIFRARGAQTVTGLRLIPDAAITANITNYATVIIRRRNADGSNPVVIGQFSSSATSVAAFATSAFTGLTNTGLTAGQLITREVTKSGSGFQLPTALLQIDLAVVAP